MKAVVTTEELANVLVASYRLNTEKQHQERCSAYRVLFEEDFYNEAADKAIAILSMENGNK